MLPPTPKQNHQIQTGQLASMATEDFTVDVEVIDKRKQFGREEYLVRPIKGSGQRWVTAARLLHLR